MEAFGIRMLLRAAEKEAAKAKVRAKVKVRQRVKVKEEPDNMI